jgi:hypothetical protein
MTPSRDARVITRAGVLLLTARGSSTGCGASAPARAPRERRQPGYLPSNLNETFSFTR